MKVQSTEHVERIAQALIDTISPKVIPDAMIPFIAVVMRRLADGHAVSAEDVARLAGDLGDPTTLVHALAAFGMADVDDQGGITGMIVTHTPTRHRLETRGHTVYTWCAVDTLFVPAVLGRDATVRSTCPVTRDSIHLEVGADGVRAASPESTYVSFVAPGVTPGVSGGCGAGASDLTGVEGAFCANANFFASERAADAWLQDHPGAAVVPLADGFELAKRIWSEPFLAGLEPG
jgi:alkylmercury lyase